MVVTKVVNMNIQHNDILHILPPRHMAHLTLLFFFHWLQCRVKAESFKRDNSNRFI